MRTLSKKELEKWAQALESGKYRQGKEFLKEYDSKAHRTRFCCLGVLEDINPRVKPDEKYPDVLLSDKLLDRDIQDFLIEVNDIGEAKKHQFNFKHIAKIIRKLPHSKTPMSKRKDILDTLIWGVFIEPTTKIRKKK